MKVLFFYTPHYRLNFISKIQLEIILTHLKAGDTVHFVSCGPNDFRKCVTNPFGKKYYCYTCRRMQDKIMRIASEYGKVVVHNYSKKTEKIIVPNFENIEALKCFKYKNIGIGIGVASWLISLLRDHGFDTVKNISKITDGIVRSQRVIDTIETLSYEIKPDLVYTFNGRMCEYAAVVQWCRLNSQPFKVYEFTSRRDSYHLVNDTIPHDVDYEANDIERTWNNSNVPLSKKMMLGSQFFENTRSGLSLLEESFITAQKEGLIPSIKDNTEIITFYNASIDEYAAVPGWDKYIYIYNDEIDAISQICAHYKDDKSKQFILRIHPNLKFLDNTQTRNLKKLDNIPNLIVVPSTSKVSSYALLDISNKIITFGSTVGIEATYFGKISILLGLCFYRDLDASYAPKDKHELFSLISNKDLAVKEQVNAIKYGYWWLSFGEKFVHYDQTYSSSRLDLTKYEKIYVIVNKIFSFEILIRSINLFKLSTYNKFKYKSFRQSLIKEFIPWDKK